MELNGTGSPQIDKIARSAAFAVLARGAMIFASTIALPVCGFMLNYAVQKLDQVVTASEKTERSLDLLAQRLQDVREVQKDHETRIRIIEVKK